MPYYNTYNTIHTIAQPQCHATRHRPLPLRIGQFAKGPRRATPTHPQPPRHPQTERTNERTTDQGIPETGSCRIRPVHCALWPLTIGLWPNAVNCKYVPFGNGQLCTAHLSVPWGFFRDGSCVPSFPTQTTPQHAQVWPRYFIFSR